MTDFSDMFDDDQPHPADPAKEMCIVRAAVGGRKEEGRQSYQYYVFYGSRETAVAAVEEQVPSTWPVELTDEYISRGAVARLGLKPGEIVTPSWDVWRPLHP